MNLNQNWRTEVDEVYRGVLKFQVVNTVNMNLNQNWSIDEASMRCNQSLLASWPGIKEGLDMFLGISSTQFVSESTKRQEWVLKDMTNKLPTNHIPDMFDGRHVGERAGQRSSDTVLQRRPPRSGIVLLKYGMWSCLKEGHRALKPP
ncbi:hypothetical protein ANN_26437 [Periplaneta americana]|uniref:Uncharacterized protein n=1 Tax=Periplaneta americana TaxID=6978 RepID=A0ABQ8RY72_PERAM|nr:hypothetical protein ANN_26437 [Periplaneta americana]